MAADLPTTIRIGYADFRLERWSTHSAHANNRWGECSPQEKVLRICADLLERDHVQAAETVLHEVMHAVWWAYGLDDKDDEERTVTGVSAGLTQVWRDNPQLVAWLNEQLANGGP